MPKSRRKHLEDKFIEWMQKQSPEQLLNVLGAGISAYGGYAAGTRLNANLPTKIGMAASGIIAFQLAKSPNMIAGGSGVLTLVSYGLINAYDPLLGGIKKEAETLAMRKAATWTYPAWKLFGGRLTPKLR